MATQSLYITRIIEATFSNDVFAVRHYVNKDAANLHSGNYIVGPKGIEELVGPPKIHNC